MFILWGNENLSKISENWRGCPDHFLRIDTEWPHWVCANKLCINYSKSNFMHMNNQINVNFLVSVNHHSKSKQSSLKYLGIILDDKLNRKPQIEKLMTQLSKSCRMLFKSKHYTSISVLKSVYFALFHSYLVDSILNWRANKTSLLNPIRLQNLWIWQFN